MCRILDRKCSIYKSIFTYPTALILKLSLSNSKISTSCEAIITTLINYYSYYRKKTL